MTSIYLDNKMHSLPFLYQCSKWKCAPVSCNEIQFTRFTHDGFYFSIINKPNVALVRVWLSHCAIVLILLLCVFVSNICYKIFQWMNEWRFCLVKERNAGDWGQKKKETIFPPNDRGVIDYWQTQAQEGNEFEQNIKRKKMKW